MGTFDGRGLAIGIAGGVGVGLVVWWLTGSSLWIGILAAIGAVIDTATQLIQSNNYAGRRLVIDISGDGPQNAGPPLTDAREAADAAGITVNGLPIQSSRQDPFRPPVNIDVARYFENHVIVGPGSFVMRSETHEDFVTALRRKLIVEIAGLSPAAVMSSDG